MTRGVRWIDGREYLLYGRYSDRDLASQAVKNARGNHISVRLVKLSNWDFLIYIHG
jgi:hypothetical protein